MYSMERTCLQVGTRWYPQFLWVTKEMMSQGMQVAEMECRESNDQ